MLKKTSTKLAPWILIRSDSKHQARLEAMKVILNSVRYRGRSKTLDMKINPKIVISAKDELKRMKKQKRKYGKYIA